MSIGFADQDTTPTTKTFRVSNTSQATVGFSGLSVPPGFAISKALSLELKPGASDDFTITLNTGTPGTFKGSVQFAASDPPGTVFHFPVTGTVVPAADGDAIMISTYEELQAIGYEAAFPLNGSYALANDIDASASSDTPDGTGFSPIGGEAASGPFTGSFDGRGFTIRHLYIQRIKQQTDKVGLFGSVGGSSSEVTIQNLNLEHFFIGGENYVGSIIGFIQPFSHVTIFNCHAEGTVSASGESSGGIVGYLDPFSTASTLSIGRSQFLGNIWGYQCAGSIVGSMANAVLDHCRAQGQVNTSATTVGGLVGQMGRGSLITESDAACELVGTRSVGGLVGHVLHFGKSRIADSWASSTIYGGVDLGGIAGSVLCIAANGEPSSATIVRCRAYGSISGEESGGGIAGGIAVIGSNFDEIHATISQCHADCDIAITGERAGGIISRMTCSADDAVNILSVTDCVAAGNITGGSLVGGICGEAWANGGGDDANVLGTRLNILNSYVRGEVVSGGKSVGGIGGTIHTWGFDMVATVRANYWNRDISNSLPPDGEADRTTAQMTWPYEDPANVYAGWDFAGVWRHGTADIKDGYPYLSFFDPTNVPHPAMIVSTNGTIIPSHGGPVDFGSTPEGGGAPMATFRISNNGNTPLRITSVSFPSGFAWAEGLSSIVYPGRFEEFTVQLLTEQQGTFTGSILLGSNDPDHEYYEFMVTGTIGPPEVDLWLAY